MRFSGTGDLSSSTRYTVRVGLRLTTVESTTRRRLAANGLRLAGAGKTRARHSPRDIHHRDTEDTEFRLQERRTIFKVLLFEGPEIRTRFAFLSPCPLCLCG